MFYGIINMHRLYKKIMYAFVLKAIMHNIVPLHKENQFDPGFVIVMHKMEVTVGARTVKHATMWGNWCNALQ